MPPLSMYPSIYLSFYLSIFLSICSSTSTKYCTCHEICTSRQKVLRLPQNLHSKAHKVLHLPPTLHFHIHKVLHLPRNVLCKVHKVLHLPRNTKKNKKQTKQIPKLSRGPFKNWSSSVEDKLCCHVFAVQGQVSVSPSLPGLRRRYEREWIRVVVSTWGCSRTKQHVQFYAVFQCRLGICAIQISCLGQLCACSILLLQCLTLLFKQNGSSWECSFSRSFH